MKSVDVLKEVSRRLIEATMMHNDFANVFRFIGLNGFAKSQEYQFLAETKEMQEVKKFSIDKLNTIFTNDRITVTDHVPVELMGIERNRVNNSDKQDMVRSIVETWVAWETETKELYSNLCVELANNHDKATELFLEDLVDDVSEELCRANILCLTLKNHDYCIENISLIQKNYAKYYDKMIKKLLKGEIADVKENSFA